MRKAAERLSIFFIITQVDRVAGYIHLFQPADTTFYLLLSYGVAIGLAYGVYISFFYVRQPKVRWAAVAGILLFGGFDLLFNELALIRTASMKTLISATSEFVWIPAVYLQDAIQLSVLAFGLLPTMASAALGWIQGGVNKVTDAEFGQMTVWQRAGKAMGKAFDSIAIRFAAGFEVVASKVSKSDTPTNVTMPAVDGQIVTSATPKKWKQLNADDVAFILAAGRGQVARQYGISDGAAGNWKRDLAGGARPWASAKKLPEHANNA